MTRYFLTFAFLFSVLLSQAQPSSGGTMPDPPDPTAVPLDGGATLMVAGGVAYGLRRLRARRTR